MRRADIVCYSIITNGMDYIFIRSYQNGVGVLAPRIRGTPAHNGLSLYRVITQFVFHRIKNVWINNLIKLSHAFF
jgi:hypothetical protein